MTGSKMNIFMETAISYTLPFSVYHLLIAVHFAYDKGVLQWVKTISSSLQRSFHQLF